MEYGRPPEDRRTFLYVYPGLSDWSLHKICGRKCGAGAGSSPTTLVSPISIVLPVFRIYSHVSWGCMVGPLRADIRCKETHLATEE
jgi:hypothetical protein